MSFQVRLLARIDSCNGVSLTPTLWQQRQLIAVRETSGGKDSKQSAPIFYGKSIPGQETSLIIGNATAVSTGNK